MICETERLKRHNWLNKRVANRLSTRKGSPILKDHITQHGDDGPVAEDDLLDALYTLIQRYGGDANWNVNRNFLKL